MAHWDDTYTARDETALTWFEAAPEMSLALIRRAGLAAGAVAVDVGAGASPLAACLLAEGFAGVTRLDLSQVALDIGARHLPPDAPVTDVVGDVTRWQPGRTYDLWHDRAAFHFLTDPQDQHRYIAVLRAATQIGAAVVLAGFAPDGPEKCSGLPVRRRSPAELAAALGPGFAPLADARHVHHTPKGNEQPFSYLLARRTG